MKSQTTIAHLCRSHMAKGIAFLGISVSLFLFLWAVVLALSLNSKQKQHTNPLLGAAFLSAIELLDAVSIQEKINALSTDIQTTLLSPEEALRKIAPDDSLHELQISQTNAAMPWVLLIRARSLTNFSQLKTQIGKVDQLVGVESFHSFMDNLEQEPWRLRLALPALTLFYAFMLVNVFFLSTLALWGQPFKTPVRTMFWQGILLCNLSAVTALSGFFLLHYFISRQSISPLPLAVPSLGGTCIFLLITSILGALSAIVTQAAASAVRTTN